ncbi:MotA/TolQ/ExbB proton channel family protein [Candidatus Calescamantes bacterium]|nr:MotA/TolQ/ExbB proton channel family protein [Candidatus Calescamantes bacterium]
MNNITGSFELFSLGGIIVIFIGIQSIIAIAVILERFFYYRRVKVLMDKAFKEIKLALAAKDYDKVLALIKSYGKLPLATILKAGIEQAPYVDMDELKEIIKDEGFRQSYYMKRRLTALSTIGTVAPLLGLLGTVTGMIRAFMVIANTMGNPEALAGGISEALFTTAAGLTVAIPVIIFYSILAGKNRLLTIDMEEKMGQIMKYLKGMRAEDI